MFSPLFSSSIWPKENANIQPLTKTHQFSVTSSSKSLCVSQWCKYTLKHKFTKIKYLMCNGTKKWVLNYASQCVSISLVQKLVRLAISSWISSGGVLIGIVHAPSRTMERREKMRINRIRRR